MATLAPIQRFHQPGITIIRFCPAIVNILSPTRAELTAGTIITKHVRAIDGFSVASDQIETPDYGTKFGAKIGGGTSSDDSSLTCYAARDGIDIRTVFARGDVGFIVMQDGGDVAIYPMDVYPVEVISVPKQRSTDEAFGVMIQFSITGEPAEDVATPALT